MSMTLVELIKKYQEGERITLSSSRINFNKYWTLAISIIIFYILFFKLGFSSFIALSIALTVIFILINILLNLIHSLQIENNNVFIKNSFKKANFSLNDIISISEFSIPPIDFLKFTFYTYIKYKINNKTKHALILNKSKFSDDFIHSPKQLLIILKNLNNE